MRTFIYAFFAICIAVLVAVLLTRLFDKATDTVRNPQPMRPAGATCPPGHAAAALICVPADIAADQAYEDGLWRVER
jgi:hypothetical protein